MTIPQHPHRHRSQLSKRQRRACAARKARARERKTKATKHTKGELPPGARLFTREIFPMTTDSADRAEWLKQPEAEARRGRQTTKSGRTAANNRTARPQTGGLFRPHSLHLGKVVQMTPNDQKEKEVWEAEQASANLPMSGQDEDDIERMRKEFDEVFAF